MLLRARIACNATSPGPLRSLALAGVARYRPRPIFVMSFLGNMAEYAVVPSISVVPIAKDVPFQSAALIGCGVTTGVGAAVKTASLRPGSTVAV